MQIFRSRPRKRALEELTAWSWSLLASTQSMGSHTRVRIPSLSSGWLGEELA